MRKNSFIGWTCYHRIVVCMHAYVYIHLLCYTGNTCRGFTWVGMRSSCSCMYVCMYVCMCRCVSPIMVCGQHILRFDVLCACCDHCDHCVFVAIIAFCVIVVPMWYVLCVCCDHRSQCVFGAIIESSSCHYTYVHAAHIIALHASVFDHR